MNFYIYIENRLVAEVDGMDFAYEVYESTCKVADLLGQIASLVDGDTGEVLASSDDWDEPDEDHMPEDSDFEMGFDPYLGCFTDDC